MPISLRLRSIVALSLLSVVAAAPPTAVAQSRAPTASTLRDSDFASIEQALEAWGARGGTLTITRDQQLRRPVQLVLRPGQQYRLVSAAPRVLSYDGARSGWMLRLVGVGAGASVAVAPSLTFDARYRANTALFIDNQQASGATADAQIGGTFRNTRSTRAVNWPDSAPLMIVGDWRRIALAEVNVSNATREAGAGIPGSRGSAGIEMVVRAAAITVRDFRIDNVGTDDPPGSPAYSDMDGLLMFARSATGRPIEPVIERGVIINARGRAIKRFVPGGGGVTRQIDIRRDTPGVATGSIDINHQDGEGLIEDIRIYYAGAAHSSPTIPISMSMSASAGGGTPAPGHIRRVRIDDRTGRERGYLVALYAGAGATRQVRRYVIEDIDDNGRNSGLVMLGALGSRGQPADITLRNIRTSVTRSLTTTDDMLSELNVTLDHVVNQGGQEVPIARLLNGQPHPSVGRWQRQGNVSGVRPG